VTTMTARSAMRLVLPAAFALGCAAAGAARAEVSAASQETPVETAAAAAPLLASNDVGTIERRDAQADAGPTAGPPPPSGASSLTSGWTFTVTPYLWITGLTGDLGVVRAIQPVHVGLSPPQLLGHLHFGVMGAVEADKDRFMAVSDNIYAYVGFSKHITIRDAAFLSATVAPKMFISTNDVGYRIIDDGPWLSVDVLGGFRLYYVKPGIRLSGPRRSFEGNQSHTWADPLIGLRAKGHLYDEWSWSLWGDIGGTSSNTDHTAQIFGSVQYAFARNWTAIAGWRFLHTQFDNGQGFVFNTNLNGPLIGASYRF
jgi:hypothetical protein